MTDTPAALASLSDGALAGRSDAAGEPAWLRDRRLEAYKRYADLDWPALRGDELWRDTPFTRFAVDVPVVVAEAPPTHLVSPLLDGADLAALIELHDGRVRVRTSEQADAAGVIVADLSEASARHEELVRGHLGRLTADGDRTVAANDAAWTSGALVYLPPELELDRPIGISVQVTEVGAHLPRILVVADRHARASVFVEHVSADVTERTTVDEVTEVVLGDGSRLDLVSLQDWDGRVGHLLFQAAELHRDAQLKHLVVTIGGETVRVRPEVRLVGAGSRIEPLGVYFSDEGQHFEHFPFIAHIAGHATSDVLYKGALQGKSRTVFRGHIYVHKDAVGSDSNETNKSLILTPGAKADSTPFLEIECADVVAGHGSATGQVDEDQLFYLESRGLKPDDALRLVVFGFFAEVLDRIELPEVRERVMSYITDELERADLSRIGTRAGRRPTDTVEEGAA